VYVPVTVAEPEATPVNATVHEPPVNEQLATTVPTVVSDEVKLRLPPGTFEAVVVSVTVAVHVEVPVGTIVVGLQPTLVDVLSLPVAVTVTVAAVLVLVL